MQTDATKVCPQCGHRQPLDQFRRRRRDSDCRISECRSCRNKRDRDRRRNARQEAVRRGVRDLSWARSQQRVVALSDALCDRLGGPAGVSQAFQEHLEACQASRNHADALRCLIGVLSLYRIADELREEE